MVTGKLRKENQQLRAEIEELQGNLIQITMKLSKENESPNEQDGGHASQSTESKDKDKFLQFISAQNDDLILFRNNTIKELKQINKKINAISKKCSDIANAVEQIEDHSHQHNIKITGMPQQNLHESAEETTSMCLKLFTAIGVDVSISDVDIALRVPARNQSNRSNAIICKFVRRMAKEKVLAAREQTSNVQPEQLHLPTATKLDNLQIYQHLTPRLQELLFEANKYKRENHFNFFGSRIKLYACERQKMIRLSSLPNCRTLLCYDEDNKLVCFFCCVNYYG